MWERAAIDCLTNGCEQLHTEVFRATSLDRGKANGQAFFAMMPSLESAVEGDPEVEGENRLTNSLRPPALLVAEDQQLSTNGIEELANAENGGPVA